MRARVEDARAATLATLGRDGRAHLVPFVFAFDSDTLYSAIDWKPKKSTRLQRLLNIERDPRVTVLVDHYDEEWACLWWVRIEGRAQLVEKGKEFDRGIDLLARKYEQYRSKTPPGPVIVIEAESWSGWSASGP
jgi:PPOX class probable F420-dependent enzyme